MFGEVLGDILGGSEGFQEREASHADVRRDFGWGFEGLRDRRLGFRAWV